MISILVRLDSRYISDDEFRVAVDVSFAVTIAVQFLTVVEWATCDGLWMCVGVASKSALIIAIAIILAVINEFMVRLRGGRIKGH